MACMIVELVIVPHQTAGCAHDRRQRRAQVMRDRRQQGVAQLLRFHFQLGAVRFRRQPDPLQRQRDLAGKGFQQPLLFGQCKPRRVERQQGQHAYHPGRGFQRQVNHLASRQGVRALSRHLSMVIHPLRHTQVAAVAGLRRSLALGINDAPRFIGQQHHCLRFKHLRHMLDRNAHDIFLAACRGQFAAHGVQRGDAALAVTGDLGLVADACRHVADHQRDQPA